MPFFTTLCLKLNIVLMKTFSNLSQALSTLHFPTYSGQTPVILTGIMEYLESGGLFLYVVFPM